MVVGEEICGLHAHWKEKDGVVVGGGGGGGGGDKRHDPQHRNLPYDCIKDTNKIIRRIIYEHKYT